MVVFVTGWKGSLRAVMVWGGVTDRVRENHVPEKSQGASQCGLSQPFPNFSAQESLRSPVKAD